MATTATSGCSNNDDMDFFAALFANDSTIESIVETHHSVDAVITRLQYISTILCVLGVIGNMLNILVLSQKSMLVSMERMERSAHYGLLALALSDLMFCVLYLPRMWVKNTMVYYSRSFALYYATYSDGFINTFLLSSTWLTVTMATSRYLAICFPLQARQLIGMTFAKTSIIVVFIVCILFNIPKYFTYRIDIVDNCQTEYHKVDGLLLDPKFQSFAAAYRWVYFVTGILIPLLVLAYCNVNLVRTLQRSSRMQVSLRASRPRTIQTTNRITLIFIIIIVLYLLMIIPGEMVHFARDIAAKTGEGHFSFNLALAVTNTCQAFNFAFNFVLYLIVNTHFRSQLCMLVHCVYLRRQGHGSHPGHTKGLNNASSTFSRQMEMSTTEQLIDGPTLITSANGRPKNSTSFTRLDESTSSSTQSTVKIEKKRPI